MPSRQKRLPVKRIRKIRTCFLSSWLFSKGRSKNLNPTLSTSVGTSNWELRQAPVVSPKNESLEKLLEKQVVTVPSPNSPGEWSNQVPACSGYATSAGNRKNSIDLVHECKSSGECSLIELKVSTRSGTPFYATYENLSYGFLYLLTRTNERLRSIFEGASDKTILKAKKIRLIVLAPTYYYEEDKKFGALLNRLENRVHEALGTFADAKVPGLEMGFEFRHFNNPVSSKQEINSFEGFDPAPYGQRVLLSLNSHKTPPSSARPCSSCP